MGKRSTSRARPVYPQTLLVQPNHQIIVYRQGLSLPLLERLVLFAEPKSLRAAITFEINAESVYLGLEYGLTIDEILSTLQQHAGREVPAGVAESIRTWSQKRDRISVYTQHFPF